MYRLILSLLLIASAASAQVDATFRAYRSVNAVDSTLLTGKPAGTLYYNLQSNKWRAKDAVGWFNLRSSGGAAGAWLTASGGTAAGVNTWTFNALDNWLVNGTATATANNQRLIDFGPTYTARATVSDAMWIEGLSGSLIYSAASQNLQALRITTNWDNTGAHATTFATIIDVQPTFTGSIAQKYALRTTTIANVNVALGANTGTARLTVGGSGTTETDVIMQLTNNAASERMRVTSTGSAVITTVLQSSNKHGLALNFSGTHTPNNAVPFGALKIEGTFGNTSTETDVNQIYINESITSATGGALAPDWFGIHNTSTFTFNAANGEFNGYDYSPTIAGSQIGSLVHKAWRHTAGYIEWASVLTPAQITSNQDDYNPTGWTSGGAPHGAQGLRVSTDASRNITSLAGGTDGRTALIENVGAFDVVLTDDDGATGTAANRFALDANVTLLPDQAAFVVYDGTSSRWRLMSGAVGSAPASITASNGLTKVVNDIQLGGTLTADVNVAGAFAVDFGTTGTDLTDFLVATSDDILLDAADAFDVEGVSVNIDNAATNAITVNASGITLAAADAGDDVTISGIDDIVLGNGATVDLLMNTTGTVDINSALVTIDNGATNSITVSNTAVTISANDAGDQVQILGHDFLNMSANDVGGAVTIQATNNGDITLTAGGASDESITMTDNGNINVVTDAAFSVTSGTSIALIPTTALTLGGATVTVSDLAGGGSQMVTVDNTGLLIPAAIPGGTTETASNGLNKVANDIQLGGALTGNISIPGAFAVDFGTTGTDLTDFMVATSDDILLDAADAFAIDGLSVDIDNGALNGMLVDATGVTITASDASADVAVTAANSVSFAFTNTLSMDGPAVVMDNGGSNNYSLGPAGISLTVGDAGDDILIDAIDATDIEGATVTVDNGASNAIGISSTGITVNAGDAGDDLTLTGIDDASLIGNDIIVDGVATVAMEAPVFTIDNATSNTITVNSVGITLAASDAGDDITVDAIDFLNMEGVTIDIDNAALNGILIDATGIQINAGDTGDDTFIGAIDVLNLEGASVVIDNAAANAITIGSTGITLSAADAGDGVTISDLAGGGTQMVTVDNTGLLSTQAIPGGGGWAVTGTTALTGDVTIDGNTNDLVFTDMPLFDVSATTVTLDNAATNTISIGATGITITSADAGDDITVDAVDVLGLEGVSIDMDNGALNGIHITSSGMSIQTQDTGDDMSLVADGNVQIIGDDLVNIRSVSVLIEGVAGTAEVTSETGTTIEATSGAVLAVTTLGGGDITVNSTDNINLTSTNGVIITDAQPALNTNSTRAATTAYVDTKVFTAKLAADHAISSTTATEVTCGATGVVAGTYIFQYYIIARSATGTVSPMFGINFTGTAAVRKMWLTYSSTGTAAITGVADDVGATSGQIQESVTVTAFTTAAPNMGATGGVATTAADILYVIEGIMIVTASGDLELWHGSETATSTTVMAGTSLILTRTN